MSNEGMVKRYQKSGPTGRLSPARAIRQGSVEDFVIEGLRRAHMHMFATDTEDR